MTQSVLPVGGADRRGHHRRGGRLSTEVVTDAFPGAKVVKAFNQPPANVLARPLPPGDGKTVIFIAGNRAQLAAEHLRVRRQCPVLIGHRDRHSQSAAG